MQLHSHVLVTMKGTFRDCFPFPLFTENRGGKKKASAGLPLRVYIYIHMACIYEYTVSVPVCILRTRCIICAVLYNPSTLKTSPVLSLRLCLMNHAAAHHRPWLAFVISEPPLGGRRSPRISLESPTKTEERADVLGSHN